MRGAAPGPHAGNEAGRYHHHARQYHHSAKLHGLRCRLAIHPLESFHDSFHLPLLVIAEHLHYGVLLGCEPRLESVRNGYVKLQLIVDVLFSEMMTASSREGLFTPGSQFHRGFTKQRYDGPSHRCG